VATVNTIAIDLIEEIEEATDDAGFVAKVEKRVNEALDEIAVATNWNSFRTRTTINTVATQAQYQLPAGAREIIQLRYTDNGQPIPNWTIQQAARRAQKIEDPGRARFWLEDGNLVSGSNVLYQFRLTPVPDSILEIEAEFYYHPSEIASGSVLPVQDNLIVIVKDRVRAYLLEGDQKYDAADRAQRRYEKNLDILVKRSQNIIAAKTVLRQSDLAIIRRRERPLLDPSHYNNGNW
jgi:hypothetical protein